MISTFQHSTVYAVDQAGETAALLKYLSQQEIDDDLPTFALIVAAEANQAHTTRSLLDIGANIEGLSQRPWIRPLWKAAKRRTLRNSAVAHKPGGRS